MKRRLWPALAFTHRWLGIAGGLLFLAWFVSGIAMIYVRMPALTADERLGHAQPLAIERVRIAPRDAAAAAGRPQAASIEVGMLGDRPVYRLGGRTPALVFADSGELVQPPSRERAVAAAQAFLATGAPVRVAEHLDVPDQWTLQLRAHFPLYRIAFADAAATVLYVSNLTGEVVLDTTRRERLLAYFGPVAHWLYLPVLRRNGPLWTQVILWSSGVGCVLCLSGLLAGLLRFSPRGAYRLRDERTMSPYEGWMKWHHYAGLIFGVITFTWTFSGLLSMGPFPLLSHEGLSGGVSRAVAGGAPDFAGLSADDVRSAAAALRSTLALKEMRLIAFRDRGYWLGTAAASDHRLVAASGPWTAFEVFDRNDIEAAARAAVKAPVVDAAWLSRYDDYYYARDDARPLPVLRVRYADEAATWAYLDPSRGAPVLVLGRRDRLNRWLYHGLHSLDPAWLRGRRPLWDLVVIALSLGGIAGVGSSFVPAWRRLRRLAPALSGVSSGDSRSR